MFILSNIEFDTRALQIIVIYLNDKIFQQIIEIKRSKFKHIFVDIIKTKIRLKLNNCKIRKKNLLWIKNRLYVFENDNFYKIKLKQLYDVSINDYVDKTQFIKKCFFFEILN